MLLDITASSDSRDIMVNIVREVADTLFIPFTVGGGMRSVADVRRMLEAGADKVSLNTAAVQNQELVREAADHFGSQCIVVAIDATAIRPTDAQSALCGRFAFSGRRITLGGVHARRQESDRKSTR